MRPRQNGGIGFVHNTCAKDLSPITLIDTAIDKAQYIRCFCVMETKQSIVLYTLILQIIGMHHPWMVRSANFLVAPRTHESRPETTQGVGVHSTRWKTA